MPHLGIHLITLNKTIDILQELDPDLFAFLDEERNRTAARWGAIGPDIFFASFYENGCLPIAFWQNIIFGFYEALQPFAEIKEEAIDPIVEAIEEVENYAEGGFPKAFESLKKRIQSLIAICTFANTLAKFDLHSFFELRVSQNALENTWYWMDMLHYRKTGAFAKNMLDELLGTDPETIIAEDSEAGENSRLLAAYAIGYMTHIATDILGHPYVNRKSGGPYRTQWHRHYLTENCMDTWTWRFYELDEVDPEELSEAAQGQLELGAEFSFSELDKALDLDDEEIERIARLLGATLNNTYSTEDDTITPPPALTLNQLESLFFYYRKLVGYSTSQGLMSPPTPLPPQFFPDIPGAIAEFYQDDGVPQPAPEDSDLISLIAAISQSIANEIERIGKIIFAIEAFQEGVATYPLRLLMYLLELSLYQLQLDMRRISVLQGLVTPFYSELTDAQLTQFANQDEADQQAENEGVADYPHRRNAPSGEPAPCDSSIGLASLVPADGHQLAYPQTGTEMPATESTIYPMSNPTEFIDKAEGDNILENLNAFAQNLRQYAQCVGPYQPSLDPQLGSGYTNELNKANAGTAPFGGAPDLGSILIIKALVDAGVIDGNTALAQEDFVNQLSMLALDDLDFNLDGDRGFGWKCWTGEFDHDPDQINNITYFGE